MDTTGTKGGYTGEKGEPREEQTVGPRIVNVSASRNFSFFVYQAKKFFKVAEEKPVVEMHAIGSAISIAVQAADSLVKHNYAKYTEIRTDQVEVERDNGVKLNRAKLFITLERSEGFEAAYEEFEKKREEQEAYRAQEAHE
mmetsp:Transcript_19561/g.19231  ORF Transcript_19561/g.19231 Transcript_19561/m.19231 type:complete len:141 (-) Transcript_19561:136-558(-)